MNKDALLATIIGFVVGLLITGILLSGPRLMGILPKMSIKLPTFSMPTAKPTPVKQIAQKEFAVTIESPLDQSIESKSDLLVSGNTSPGSTVVITGVSDDAISSAKEDGKYAGKITLVEGENNITVTSYLKDKKATQTVTVFYTLEDF